MFYVLFGGNFNHNSRMNICPLFSQNIKAEVLLPRLIGSILVPNYDRYIYNYNTGVAACLQKILTKHKAKVVL
jgi:hypothetical protein